MHTKPLALAACFLLFAGAASAALTASQDGSDRYVFEPGEQMRFQLETVYRFNYTLEVVNGSWTTSQPMTFIRERENSSIYVYEANFTPSAGVLVGDAVAYAKDVNGSTWGVFDFHMAAERPRVFDVEQIPLFPPPDSDVTVIANVSDVGANITTAALDHDGDLSAMSPVGSGAHWAAYRETITVGSAGTESYDLIMEDVDGNQRTTTRTVQVVAGASPADSEDVGVGVHIPPECNIAIRNFFTPGLDFVLGLNATGMITADILNQGSVDANVTADLNVTFEDDDEWQPGEPIGNVTRDYNSTTFTLDAQLLSNSSFTYMKPFTGAKVGWHTARLTANASCTINNEMVSNTASGHETFVVLNATGGVSFGNETTNKTFPADANRTGEESNQTTPADANETGEESNQTVEANATEPGETGEPIPQPGDSSNPGETPVPEPEPEPIPILSLTLQETEDPYQTAKAQYAPINLSVSNVWQQDITGVTVTPQIGALGDGWEARSASLDTIASGANTSRTVFIRPPPSAQPGIYRIPVMATTQDRRLELEYINLRVLQSVFGSRVQIQEVPRNIRITANRSETVPVLIRNVGSTALTNVTAELQSADGVTSVNVTPVRNVTVNGTAAVLLNVTGGSDLTTGNATLIVRTAEGAYSFADVQVAVRAAGEGIIPAEYRFPLVASVWTIVLVLYALLGRRFDLESWYVKAPLVVLIVGEATIILFVASEYYGISRGFLPF